MTMDAIEKVRRFMLERVRPALDEVAATKRLTEDYAVSIVDGEESGDEIVNRMIAILREGTADDHTKIFGQTLVIEERDPAKKKPFYAGRYLVSPLCRIAGAEVYASPVALFQMQFDGKTHKFMHRYDNSDRRPW
jgi:hypothetical protein